MNPINNRIADLRLNMKEQHLDAFIVPSSDPHQGEYVAAHWQFRQWISGFTGSAGLFFLTQDDAGLSTDSRYFIQAETELANSEVVLHKQKVAHSPQIIPWLKEKLTEGSRVGIDPQLFSINDIKSFEKDLSVSGIVLHFTTDLTDKVWKNRPDLPNDKIFELPLKYAGVSRPEKIAAIRKEMSRVGVDYHLVTTLDDIAWIFNIRGNDVEYNPVAIAYAIISKNDCTLFINEQKIPQALLKAFEAEQIKVLPYEKVSTFLESLSDQESILLDPSKTNGHLDKAIKNAEVVHGGTISTTIKAIKNPTEVNNIKKAMLKDGVALTKLFRWLEETIEVRPVPETEVASQLAQFRGEQGEYHGESFSAIVGYKGNGAIIHYHANKETCAKILPEGILLLDSGGQYLCGTTDITRTVALSKPDAIQKRDYTLVLKGHIALARLKFPYGTRGNQMELLARKALWEYGLDYSHGTGHGVGFFLNVHEGPQALGSGATAKATVVFEPGMFTSNEPGFYKEGEYGIRIENLILCVEGQTTPFGQFLTFETLTLFPIDTNLIDFYLLAKEEVQWLNDYHAEVFGKLAPLLDEQERAWMKERCKAI
ncbi:MAG: Xaa-Pro aminopeptidase [Saprospiraceae bacterium]|jgi:Xaa-Pro aminopeptidase